MKFPRLRREYTITTDCFHFIVLSNLSETPQRFSNIIAILNHNRKLANKVVSKLYRMKLIISTDGSITRLQDNCNFTLNPRYINDRLRITIPPIKETEFIDTIYGSEIDLSIIYYLMLEYRIPYNILVMKVKEKLQEHPFLDIDSISNAINKLDGEYLEIRTDGDQKDVIFTPPR